MLLAAADMLVDSIDVFDQGLLLGPIDAYHAACRAAICACHYYYGITSANQHFCLMTNDAPFIEKWPNDETAAQQAEACHSLFALGHSSLYHFVREADDFHKTSFA